jgi:hypothetical protein
MSQVGIPLPRGPCRHGMARPPVADGRRVAANMLNKQSRTANKGCSPAWVLGEVLTTYRKNFSMSRSKHNIHGLALRWAEHVALRGKERCMQSFSGET